MPKGIFIRSEEHKRKLREHLKSITVRGEEWHKRFPGQRYRLRSFLRSWKVNDPEGWARYCKKIGDSARGKKHSIETRAKMSSIQRKLRVGWKGGRVKQSNGYVLISRPDHPAQSNSYVLEHRLVMEKHLGRYLTRQEEIHHINGVRDDNRIENLELFSSKAKHSAFHDKLGRVNDTRRRQRETGIL
jgi:uncharacterized protein (DUF1330 family)